MSARRSVFGGRGAWAAAFTFAAGTGAIASLQPVSSLPASNHAPIEAITKPRHDLELAFTVAGRVAARLVEPGQQVHAGDPLLRLDDAEQRANMELLRLRANSDLEVQNAQADFQMAQTAESRIRDAHSRDAAAKFEVERASMETKQAALRLQLFKQRKLEAALTLKQAERSYEKLTLRAPIDATVEQVIVEPGETVEALRPVLRLVVTQTMLVEAPAPTASTLPLQVGDPAWIRWRLPGKPRIAQGRITHIAAVADPASDTRMVRIDAPNRFNLPAGSQVDVWLDEPPVAVEASRKRTHASLQGRISLARKGRSS